MKIADVAFSRMQIGEALAEYAMRRGLVSLPNGDVRLEWSVASGEPLAIQMEFHVGTPAETETPR